MYQRVIPSYTNLFGVLGDESDLVWLGSEPLPFFSSQLFPFVNRKIDKNLFVRVFFPHPTELDRP